MIGTYLRRGVLLGLFLFVGPVHAVLEPEELRALLEKIQQKLFERASNYRKENTRAVSSYAEFKEIISNKGGFISAHWDGSKEIEAQIKLETKATVRCLPLEKNPEPGKCIVTGLPSSQRAIFAIAY